MARLIEFFTKTGELVLDPFAGVGGTLLGAAIARGPRRAIGLEINPAWAAVYAEVVTSLAGERDGAGPLLADLGTADPGGPRPFDPGGCEMRIGDALALLPGARRREHRLRGDRPALHRAAPPHDGRRPAGRDARQPSHRLRDALRRPGRPGECPDARRLPRRHGAGLRGAGAGAAPGPLCSRDRARRLRRRGLPLHRRRSRRPRLGGRPRAEGRPRLVPGGDPAAPVRLPAGVRSQHHPPAHRDPAPRTRRRAPAAAVSRARAPPGRPSGRRRRCRARARPGP